ncbi:uncharacterized protein LOC122160035 [Centrocercus urophasianus]|uniref:uncharacterized protein LOC122160035 n=1 Tax=Centrocercus urophasianus TaxID=9002 RepID=UPI001C64677A|nr:uncharacterized protein LOC122160035 [Centrocercus urophasianus]
MLVSICNSRAEEAIICQAGLPATKSRADQAAQDPIQSGLELLQRWNAYSSLGSNAKASLFSVNWPSCGLLGNRNGCVRQHVVTPTDVIPGSESAVCQKQEPIAVAVNSNPWSSGSPGTGRSAHYSSSGGRLGKRSQDSPRTLGGRRQKRPGVSSAGGVMEAVIKVIFHACKIYCGKNVPSKKEISATLSLLEKEGLLSSPSDLYDPDSWDSFTAALSQRTMLTQKAAEFKVWGLILTALRKAKEEKIAGDRARELLGLGPGGGSCLPYRFAGGQDGADSFGPTRNNDPGDKEERSEAGAIIP